MAFLQLDVSPKILLIFFWISLSIKYDYKVNNKFPNWELKE